MLQKVFELVMDQTKDKGSIIIVYAILPRKDVEQERIDAINRGIESYIGNRAEFVNLGSFLNLNSDYDDHVHLNLAGYQKWVKFMIK